MQKKSLQFVILAMMTAILLVVQVSLAFLPNIELVSLMIIIFTLALGKRVFYVIYAFVLLEGLIFGFGLWWISYLYIWSILALVTLAFRKNKSVIFWSTLSGVYGLSYGALTGIVNIFLSGMPGFIGYWISGIPFDIIHCIGNFICMLVLFKPILSVVTKLIKKT